MVNPVICLAFKFTSRDEMGPNPTALPPPVFLKATFLTCAAPPEN